MNAEYKCLGCGYEWACWPKPPMLYECGYRCPACGNLYVKWMNYEAWCAEHKVTSELDNPHWR